VSVKVTTWVWDHAPVTEVDQMLVLLALADYADEETWTAWPTIKKLATKVRMSQRTVQRHLRDLETAGRLSTKLNAGGKREMDPRYRPNAYQILGVSHAVTPTGPGVTETAPRGDRKGTSGVSLVSPRTVNEPSLEPRAREADPEPIADREASLARLRELKEAL
jgi:DNA-binding transcriptional ArsR family regulator